LKVDGKNYRTVWMEGSSVFLIEQNLLPFEFKIYEAKDHNSTCVAIKDMLVRGAGAIGSAAGFAMAQAFLESDNENYIIDAKKRIESTRPTAQNLFYATDLVFKRAINASDKRTEAVKAANYIADKDAEDSLLIGRYGNDIIPGKAGILTQLHKMGCCIIRDYSMGYLGIIQFPGSQSCSLGSGSGFIGIHKDIFILFIS